MVIAINTFSVSQNFHPHNLFSG